MANNTRLNVTTINVNGLKDTGKRKRFFELFKVKNYDIIFLQETHCTNLEESKLWGKEWGGENFWSFGGARSRGVGILFSSRLSFSKGRFYYDQMGRLIVLDIYVNNVAFRLMNVYAPNEHAERTPWLNDLERWFAGNKIFIFGGDFNCVDNVKIDKIGGNPIYGEVGADALRKIRENFNLLDPYRKSFPRDVTVTWVSGDGSIGCRLDRFYVSKCLSKCCRTIIAPTPDSDHSAVEMCINFADGIQTKGPGYWKCNVKVLDDCDFIADMTDLCAERMALANRDLEWWEESKARFKRLIVIHSCRLAANNRRRLNELESELRVLQQQELQNHGQHAEEIIRLKNQIKTFVDEISDGVKVRSRAKYFDTEEKPSSYFLRKEKARGAKSTINELSVNGRKITETNEIIAACKSFYEQLYSSEPIDEQAADILLSKITPLSEDAAKSCEGEITVGECTAAIKDMENNKTPGSDGLPKEFYAKFFNLFADGFVAMLNDAHAAGRLSESQRYGLITLACKDESKADQLGNWRPISLLNVDYKILSKVLSKRLGRILGSCVHKDQTCAVPGRSIQDNLHLFRNVVDYCAEANVHAAIVSFDQAKAFDRVSHDYLCRVLRAFGFGDDFIRWISIMYTDISSSVLVNGFISDRFAVRRSVRQGCPLSALLYVLCIEPLAIAIRGDTRILGVKIPGSRETARLALYADDTNSIVSDDATIGATLQWFDVYSLASGAKLNSDKCKGLRLGAWRSRTDKPFGFVWENCSKINGVYFGENSTYKNGTMLMQKVEKSCNLFSSRYLTLRGRAVIANIVICAQLWYVGAIVRLPDTLLKIVNRKIFGFIWGGKVEAVSRKTVCLNPLRGGLGLTNIETKLQSLRCAHLHRFVTGCEAKWTEYAAFWAGLTLRHLNPGFASNARLHAERASAFYEEALDVYYKFRKGKFDFSARDLSAKHAYEWLSRQKVEEPVIVGKFPYIDFKVAWQTLSANLVSPRARDLEWRILHHVVPVNEYLFRLHINRNEICPFCKWPETVSHRFFSCSVVRPIWRLIGLWMADAIEQKFEITHEMAVFLQYPASLEPELKILLSILAGELKTAVWMQRNRRKYEKKQPQLDDIARLFISFVGDRIRADFYRLDADVFTGLWSRGRKPIAVVAGRQLTLSLPTG